MHQTILQAVVSVLAIAAVVALAAALERKRHLGRMFARYRARAARSVPLDGFRPTPIGDMSWTQRPYPMRPQDVIR